MTFKDYKKTTAITRVRAYLDAREKALRRKVNATVERFLKFFEHESKNQNRWPFDFEPKHDEIAKLINYLFELRHSPTPTWMRGPWIEARDGSLCASQLPTSNDGEPKNCGEECLTLLRKYWQLAFGFQHGKTSVAGIAKMIFEAATIDNLTVGLLIRDSSKGNLKEVAKELKGSVDQVSRTDSPSTKKRTGTVRQKIRNLEKPRRK